MTNADSSKEVVTTDAVASQRMDPEKKAAWVAALRSGNYRQGRGILHDGAGYCCLGVFGDLQNIPTHVLRKWGGVNLEFDESLQPLSAINHAVRNQLAQMNDSGKTFPEIADYIEENL